MAVNDTKTFMLSKPGVGGVAMEVVITDNGDGTTDWVVKCTNGSVDVDAIYWNDLVGGQDTGAAFSAVAGSLSGLNPTSGALNMNGAPGGNISWDSGIKLADSGYGGGGSTVLTAGSAHDTFKLHLAANWDSIDQLGMRVGGQKLVDTDATVHQAPHLGAELVQNWDFEAQVASVPDGGFAQFATATGWTNLVSAPVELQSVNYTGNMATGPMAGSNEK